MRHPGLQSQNRFRELSDALSRATAEVRHTNGLVSEHGKKLNEAISKRDAAYAQMRKVKALMDRLVTADGVFDWGLPACIRIAEFRELCPRADIPSQDEALEEQYHNSKKANAERVREEGKP